MPKRTNVRQGGLDKPLFMRTSVRQKFGLFFDGLSGKKVNRILKFFWTEPNVQPNIWLLKSKAFSLPLLPSR